jgi:hypothetical protein
MPEGGPGAVEAADAGMAEEKRAMMASTAPPPTKPFSVKAIQTLIKSFNETVETFSGGELPDLIWEAPEGTGDKWNSPLPPEIYAPLVAMREAVDIVGGGEFSDDYAFQPTEIEDDMSLRKATADLMKMKKDKKLIAAMRAPLEEAAGEEMEMEEAPKGRAPMPSEMGEKDKALMDNMK